MPEVGRVFDADQQNVLELMLDRQTNNIVNLLTSEIVKHFEKCEQSRPCKGMDLADKKDIDIEILTAFKKNPMFWLKIIAVVILVNRLTKIESINSLMVAAIGKVFS
jgi:hypothetical protein